MQDFIKNKNNKTSHGITCIIYIYISVHQLDLKLYRHEITEINCFVGLQFYSEVNNETLSTPQLMHMLSYRKEMLKPK